MKKILILTAAFGDGHNTAARNIRDALEHICDDVKVEVLDLFEASYGAFNTLAKKNYLANGKAGGATVQGAIAARCPMIVNQVIPGQEEGNARLIQKLGLGAIAKKERHVADWVEEAFAHRASLWTEWRRNLERISKPDASLRIAELILAECDRTDRKKIALFEPGARPTLQRAP